MKSVLLETHLDLYRRPIPALSRTFSTFKPLPLLQSLMVRKAASPPLNTLADPLKSTSSYPRDPYVFSNTPLKDAQTSR